MDFIYQDIICKLYHIKAKNESMALKIFKAQKIGIATALITATTLLSYVAGLIRDRIIATHFGTTTATDVYNASFLIPDILFNMFIAGALAAAFLPIFSEQLEIDKQKAFSVANTMLTVSVLFMLFLTILAYFFVPYLVPKIFSTATTSMHQDIIEMTRYMLPSAVFFAISNTLGNILMSYKRFFSYSISPILYNFGIIIGVVFLHESLGIYSAALGVLIGTILHAIIRIIDSFGTDYRFKPQLKLKDPAFVKIAKLMMPKSISLIGWQINLYIFAIIGIKIIEGGLAAFNFARNIQSFAVSIFGVSFATAVFPYLADHGSAKDKTQFTRNIQKTVQRILFFTIPSAAGIMVLSREIVELILSGGLFDEKSILLTSSLLFFFGLSIPFESLTHILSRAFYAIKNTLIPTIAHVCSMTLIAVITIFVAPKLGIEWFSIGFAAGFLLYGLMLALLLKKHLHKFDTGEFITSLTKTVLSTAVMILAIYLSANLAEIMNEKLAYILQITIGGAVFLVTAALLRAQEIGSINYILGRIFKKPTGEKV